MMGTVSKIAAPLAFQFLDALEIIFFDRRYQGIVGIYHVTYIKSTSLGKKIISIPAMKIIFFFKPPDELCVSYASSIFHRSGAADHHDLVW